MNPCRLKSRSVQRKLIQSFIASLVLGTIAIGVASFFPARNALNRKGEIILENSVKQAIQLIKAEQAQVKFGVKSLEEALEYVKTELLGPVNKDGSRNLHHHVNLGENGYFIVYSVNGVEIMHPTLEGQNVWDVRSMDRDDRLLVQEQIEVARNGGGFCSYSWLFPNSNKVGKKLSYSKYEPGWEWVVVATAYNLDFNRDARMILLYILVLTVVIVGTVGLMGVRSVRKIVKPSIVRLGTCKEFSFFPSRPLPPAVCS